MCARILVIVNITLSINDDTIEEARRRAEALGTSVNQLVRDYLDQFVGKSDAEGVAREFQMLSSKSKGASAGWKFNREELHERQ
jgi:hypothetical protein